MHEVPDGSNRGARVDKYQDVCTPGYHGYPWCAAFVQYVLQAGGVGPIANHTAGVYYLLDYARKHGWATSKPEKGELVCFIRGAGHIGLVQGVGADGKTFTTIEGNTSNGVHERVHNTSEPVAFVKVLGVTTETTKVYYRVPRFEVVTSEKGHAVVLLRWNKWAKIGPKLPKLARKYHDLRLRRKVVKTWKRVPA